MADSNPKGDNGAQLKAYGLVGAGALKIRWNTSGDFTRCVRELDKHMPGRAEGYCANLHYIATGMWTRDERNQ